MRSNFGTSAVKNGQVNGLDDRILAIFSIKGRKGYCFDRTVDY